MDEAVEMASMNQFFYFVFECLAFVCCMVILIGGSVSIWSCLLWEG